MADTIYDPSLVTLEQKKDWLGGDNKVNAEPVHSKERDLDADDWNKVVLSVAETALMVEGMDVASSDLVDFNLKLHLEGGGTLATAITEIGSSNRTISVAPGLAVPVVGDLTIPKNVTMKVMRGSMISISAGVTLTVDGFIDAGPVQLFSLGAGASVVSDPDCLTSVVRPEWWGALGNGNLNTDSTLATAHDDTTAIQAAINFFRARLQDNGGEVLFRPTCYKFTSQLVMRDQVALIGFGSRKRFGWQGTVLAHRPSSDQTTPAILCEVGDPAGGYAMCRIEHITIAGDAWVNDRSKMGLSTEACQHRIIDCTIRGFTELNLRVLYPLFSHFEQLYLAGPGSNLYLAGRLDHSGPGTTCTFNEIYATSCTLSAHPSIEIIDQTNVLFSHLILEANDHDSVWIDGCSTMVFNHVYCEANQGNLFRVGFNGQVRSLDIRDLLFLGTSSGLSKATDYVQLDDVLFASVHVAASHSGNKASYVRCTANTKRVNFRGPINTTLPFEADARQNSTNYALGDWISVPEDNGLLATPRTLVFTCVQAGQTAAANPGTYTCGANSVVDGTARFAHAGLSVISANGISQEEMIDDDYYSTIAAPMVRLRGGGRTLDYLFGVIYELFPEEFHIKDTRAGQESLIAARPTGSVGGGGGFMRLLANYYSATHKITMGHEVEINGEVGLKVLGADPAATTATLQFYAKADGLYVRFPTTGVVKKVTFDP